MTYHHCFAKSLSFLLSEYSRPAGTGTWTSIADHLTGATHSVRTCKHALPGHPSTLPYCQARLTCFSSDRRRVCVCCEVAQPRIDQRHWIGVGCWWRRRSSNSNRRRRSRSRNRSWWRRRRKKSWDRSRGENRNGSWSRSRSSSPQGSDVPTGGTKDHCLLSVDVGKAIAREAEKVERQQVAQCRIGSSCAEGGEGGRWLVGIEEGDCNKDQYPSPDTSSLRTYRGSRTRH